MLARRHSVLVVQELRLWCKFQVPCLPEMAQDLVAGGVLLPDAAGHDRPRQRGAVHAHAR